MQNPVELLPESALIFLLGSRYCETDQLTGIAWQLFGHGPTGWTRVQAICDFVHQHIAFGYQHARRTRTAWEAYLGDQWYTFGARNNKPRIGRVLMARGRDACDVALASTFGPNTLTKFTVWTDEI